MFYQKLLLALVQLSLWLLAMIYFIALPTNTFAQENCANAIDDDGDGLIDLNDPDCAICGTSQYILDPTFSDTLCCPNNAGQISCLRHWIDPSNFTSDFFHPCWDAPYPLHYPPLLDGSGFIGYSFSSNISISASDYIGTCTSVPLPNGRYQIQFLHSFNAMSPPFSDTPPITSVAVFGHADCQSMPYPLTPRCPLENGEPGWILLNEKLVLRDTNWQNVTIDFEINEPIQAIVIGSSCSSAIPVYTYFYLDNIYLYTLSEVPQIVEGLPCSEQFEIGVSSNPTAQYQWYRDGIAIIGATSPNLTIEQPETPGGSYQCQIIEADSCILSAPYRHQLSTLPIAELGRDTLYLCVGDTIILGAENRGEHYEWNTGDTLPVLLITSTGHYSVTIVDACGNSSEDAVEILSSENLTCNLVFPTAFSPDGDGVNDSFGCITDCCIIAYEFSIYNRWGQRVFITQTLDDKWHGTMEGFGVSSDVYVWTAKIKLASGQTILRKGDITLLR
ncbi:MAG: gliding motility-associated C-terminal domain-containing protein [Saprospiraceae bacterium]|nr:gliding motility-associated C-terminal domain-containing protein [Saprospiraceae bacterium]MBP7699800.1 gliding motility-associated C-terminal domain-containing protein [Saprospiraceae bacterium]